MFQCDFIKVDLRETKRERFSVSIDIDIKKHKLILQKVLRNYDEKEHFYLVKMMFKTNRMR